MSDGEPLPIVIELPTLIDEVHVALGRLHDTGGPGMVFCFGRSGDRAFYAVRLETDERMDLLAATLSDVAARIRARQF